MPRTRQPLILAIDTSCDDTSVAVTSGLRVISNVVASQTQLHKQYGGVFPTVAKLAHKENIEPTIRAALRGARCTAGEITAVAVTVGPGLAPALEVGIRAAETWARTNAVPVLAVNHLEGHLLSVLTQPNSRSPEPPREPDDAALFPALGMIVSGGHTQLLKIRQVGRYELLGTTLDDAAGECLDKIGRMLNLGYPAGAAIEELARTGNRETVTFPLPLTHQKTFDFSFSGLKTFARNYLEAVSEKDRHSSQFIRDFCASAQWGVFRHILYKAQRALEANPEIRSVWLGGGVAANMQLRTLLRQSIRDVDKKNPLTGGVKRRLLVPYCKKLCADNAAMIGVVAGLRGDALKDENLDRQPRMRL